MMKNGSEDYQPSLKDVGAIRASLHKHNGHSKSDMFFFTTQYVAWLTLCISLYPYDLLPYLSYFSVIAFLFVNLYLVRYIFLFYKSNSKVKTH